MQGCLGTTAGIYPGKTDAAGRPFNRSSGGEGSVADRTGKTRNAKSDLNRADRDELVSVPGIGPAVAKSILKQRGDRGGFKSLDELSDVSGIGAQTVQNLRERFTVSGKRAGAESTSKGAAHATRSSSRTTEETAKRSLQIAGETTRRSADTATEIAGRSADVAGDAGERTSEAAAQTGKAGMEALERVGEKSREGLRSAGPPASRGDDELISQGTDGLDAMAASGRALFDSMQELHREWLSFAQAQFSESMEAGWEFVRCRSPKDLLDVQMRYTRSSADRILTEATKLAGLSVRVASASLQPLQARAGSTERLRS
jgi:competence ComEA-like helix-hairpin-helix protein